MIYIFPPTNKSWKKIPVLVTFYVLTINSIFTIQAQPITSLAQNEISDESLVSFSPSFFDRYQPNTALDMVNQIPGFNIDDGGNKRGFGGAVGNVFINNRRPSAKQDPPSAILGRIAYRNVERIELIRGQKQGLNMQGQTVVVNVILKADVPAAIRWQTSLNHNFTHGLSPGGSISLSHRIASIEYNAGLDGRYTTYGDRGPINIYDGNGGLIEKRYEDDGGPGFEGFDANGYLNASTWLGENFIQLNSKLGAAIRDEVLINTISPQVLTNGSRQDIIENERRNIQYALGLDVERLIQPDLIGKAILLYYLLDQYPTNTRRNFNSDGDMTLYRVVDIDALTTEAIARLELTWAGLVDHEIQVSLEGAYNNLDSNLIQTDRTTSGSAIINVPGSNSEVEETRSDFVLKDTWSINSISLEYGLGAEVSTITQKGDDELKRSFFFIKPYANLTYAPFLEQQIRVRIAREVSQLNFNDFVSATIFRDDVLALGNPNLRPETTWVTESTYEKRFGEIGVASITAFYHWITNVEDLLPLSPTFEAPGNIGNGRRWGLEFESTVPLSLIGLESSRLDFKARWQNSSVTDPVTGLKRVLSGVGGIDPGFLFDNGNKYIYTVAFRQDLKDYRVSWGIDMASQSERLLFKVNELNTHNEGIGLNAFVETTRWFNLNYRLSASNILNYKDNRDRIIFVGERDLSPVNTREIRSLQSGRRLALTVRGSF